MAEIISFKGAQLPQSGPEPIPEIIELLEMTLERAKKGELVALSIVAVSPDDLMPRMYAKGVSCYVLMSGLELLKSRIVATMELHAR